MSKTKGAFLTAAERKEKALELRKKSHTFAEIGAAIGVSAQMASKIVTNYLRDIAARNDASAGELRQLELEKLDAQERRLTRAIEDLLEPPAGAPERIAAILLPDTLKLLPRLEDSLLRVRQHRAKLLGLIAPTQILVPVDTSQRGRVEAVSTDPRLLEIVEEARAWTPPRLAIAEPPPDAEREVG